MPNAHDRGGWPAEQPIDRTEHPTADWEMEAYGLAISLIKKGYMRSGESRLPQERMSREEYESLRYYERTSASLEALAIEKNLLTREDIDRKVAEMDAREADG